MTDHAVKKKNRSSSSLLQTAVYCLFFVLLTAFSCILLVQYLRMIEIPEPDEFKPAIPKPPPLPPPEPERIILPNPTRLKSEAIWTALGNRNFSELTELLSTAQPIDLYAYSQNRKYNHKAHLYTRIFHLKCPNSLRILLNSGLIDPNAHTLLHKAIRHFAQIQNPIETRFYEVLLQHGVDIEYANEDGLTPLALAAHKNNLTALNYLIEHGAILNRSLPKSDSILHYMINEFIQSLCSVDNGYKNVIETLIKAGANVFYRGKDGCTAFHHAILLQTNPEVHQIFIDTVPDRFNSEAYRKALVNFPISPDNVETPTKLSLYGYTPLHLAVHQRSLDMATLFIQHGADLRGTDNSGLTPFDHAEIVRNRDLKVLLTFQ